MIYETHSSKLLKAFFSFGIMNGAKKQQQKRKTKAERNYYYNRSSFFCFCLYIVNYGECVQLIILFLYHLSTPEKKRGEITFLTPHSRFFLLCFCLNFIFSHRVARYF